MPHLRLLLVLISTKNHDGRDAEKELFAVARFGICFSREPLNYKAISVPPLYLDPHIVQISEFKAFMSKGRPGRMLFSLVCIPSRV
jgi:hypothetical protein